MKALKIFGQMIKTLFSKVKVKKMFVFICGVVTAFFSVCGVIECYNNSFSEASENSCVSFAVDLWNNGIGDTEYESLTLEAKSSENPTIVFNNALSTPECQNIDIIMDMGDIEIRKRGNCIKIINQEEVSKYIEINFVEKEYTVKQKFDDEKLLVLIVGFAAFVPVSCLVADLLYSIIEFIVGFFVKGFRKFKKSFEDAKEIVESEQKNKT